MSSGGAGDVSKESNVAIYTMFIFLLKRKPAGGGSPTEHNGALPFPIQLCIAFMVTGCCSTLGRKR